MAFYDLSKNERSAIVDDINKNILQELNKLQCKKTITYFQDEDTYIRKSAYLAVGKIYVDQVELRDRARKYIKVKIF
jgi:vesicle coat complex subunit